MQPTAVGPKNVSINDQDPQLPPAREPSGYRLYQHRTPSSPLLPSIENASDSDISAQVGSEKNVLRSMLPLGHFNSYSRPSFNCDGERRAHRGIRITGGDRSFAATIPLSNLSKFKLILPCLLAENVPENIVAFFSGRILECRSLDVQ